MHDINTDCYIVVADTNKYAGNFERELVAFVTGALGDCGVGREAAQEARNDFERDGFRLPDPLRFGETYYRPATIFPSPRGAYNSVAWAYDVPPTNEELRLYYQRAQKYCDSKGIELFSLRLLSRRIIVTDTELTRL